MDASPLTLTAYVEPKMNISVTLHPLWQMKIVLKYVVATLEVPLRRGISTRLNTKCIMYTICYIHIYRFTFRSL